MKGKLKLLLLGLLSVLMLSLISCGDDKSDNTTNNTDTSNIPTNQQYYDYLTERYNHYFKDNKLDSDYDVYVDDFTYNGTYDEFISAYNGTYDNLKTDLESFKSDLENNVIKGNAEVDKYNQDVITATDKAIIAVDDYSGSFSEKAKDYATLSKDEVVKGLRTIGSSAHDARVYLSNLVNDAKSKLGL